MKRKQFSKEQIIGILREVEAGAVVTEPRRRHGISTATFHAWKAKFGDMEGEPLSAIGSRTRLRAIEDWNGTLRSLLADAMLGDARLRDLLAR